MSVARALSVNERAAKLVARMIAEAEELRIGVGKGALGETLIDCGSKAVGSLTAGLRVAEICTGGLADVAIAPSSLGPRWPWTIMMRSSQPVIACLASQYAGWRLSVDDGDESLMLITVQKLGSEFYEL